MPTPIRYEAHSLNSLSKRVLIGRAQLAAKLNAGEIKLLPGSHSRSFILTTEQCDELRGASIARLSAGLDSLGLTVAEKRKIVETTTQLCQLATDAEIAVAAGPAAVAEFQKARPFKL
jgi:hypothetical protein